MLWALLYWKYNRFAERLSSRFAGITCQRRLAFKAVFGFVVIAAIIGPCELLKSHRRSTLSTQRSGSASSKALRV